MRKHEDGDFPHGNEFEAIAKQALAESTFVENGCTPSTGSGDFDIDIASGSVRVNGSQYSVGGTVTVDSEGTFSRRYDLIYIDNTGNIQVEKGTEDSKAPLTPADSCLIAIVKIDNGASQILSDDIKDARIIYILPLHASRHEDGGTDEISVQGLSGVLNDAQTPQAHGNSKHSPDMLQNDDHDDTNNITSYATDSSPTQGHERDIPFGGHYHLEVDYHSNTSGTISLEKDDGTTIASKYASDTNDDTETITMEGDVFLDDESEYLIVAVSADGSQDVETVTVEKSTLKGVYFHFITSH